MLEQILDQESGLQGVRFSYGTWRSQKDTQAEETNRVYGFGEDGGSGL